MRVDCRVSVGVVCAGSLVALAGLARGEVAWLSETANDPAAVAAIVESQAIASRAAVDVGAARASLARVAALEGEATCRVVVRFSGAIDDAERAALSARGIELGSWLGGGSYFARVEPARLRVDEAAAIGGMVGVEEIRREWKMHPTLVAGEIPEHARLGGGGGERVAVYAVFHRDVTLADGRAAAGVVGAIVRDELETINGLVLEVPRGRMDALIDDARVQWVEPALPRMSGTNAENRVLMQVDDLQAPPYGLDGTGVTAMVYDGGLALFSHQDFGGRLTVHDASGIHYHPTHVAGTVGGSGSVTPANRGMAPNATLLSYGYEYDGTGVFLYTNPGDVETDYASAFGTQGALVSNNSIGSNVEPNGFSCSYQGDYGVMSSVIDAIIDGSLGVATRVVWAAGNERQGSRCDVEGHGDYYSSAPPSLAKNSIGVGAVNSNDDSMTSFSSWGPAEDGRVKPDIVAPGCQSTGDGGVTSTGDGSTTQYITLCGTSMAAPTVTGGVALLLQDFQAQFPGRDLPMNSTVKALLIHNAVDLGNPGPDYVFGYGSVRMKDTVDFMRTDQFLEGSVGDGETTQLAVMVDAGAPEFRATLVWDDAPGTPNVNPALVNDLDLVVRDPSGVRRYPWTLDPIAPSVSAVQNAEDHLNNVEQVHVANPEAGTWTIELVGTGVPEGPQTFSLTTSAAPIVTGVSMRVLSGIPEYAAPGDPIDVDVEIEAIDQSLVGTPQVFWRYDGGTFSSAALTPAGGTVYTASLPAPDCEDVVEFYFSAEGDTTGVHTLPASAPASAFSPAVGEEVEPAYFDFEVASGWVVNPDLTDTATTGAWEVADPEGTAAQPENDASEPGTMCFVTDGTAGASLGSFDIDGGTTTLQSGPIDLSGLDAATMSYQRWYSNDTGAGPNDDVFVVDISDDGGNSWVNVETVGPSGLGTSGGWIGHEFEVSDFVSLTSDVRIRFIAEDGNIGSLVEAAVDEVRVRSEVCNFVPPPDPCPADLDGNLVIDVFDFNIFAPNFGMTGLPPFTGGDLDGDGDVDVFDFNAFAPQFGQACP